MRIDQLSFTRFVGSIIVVLCHYGNVNGGFFAPFFTNATCIISYFFVLSGFVMIIAYNNKNVVPGIYYINRFARIYPIYLVALLLVLYEHLLSNQEVTPEEFILNLFGVQSWLPGYPLTMNYPGWSLSNEFFFYALFPFLLNFIYRKYSFKKLAIGIIAFWLITQVVCIWIESTYQFEFKTKGWDFLYYFPLFHLNQFLIGNLAGLFFLRLPARSFTKYNTLWFFGLMAIVFFLIRYPLPFFYHNGMFAILFVPVIFLLAKNEGWLSKLLNWKPLVFLGEISYGIYILQYPVYEYCRMLFNSLGWQQNFFVYLFILLAAAIFSYICIETPLRKYINKLTPAKKKGTVPSVKFRPVSEK